MPILYEKGVIFMRKKYNGGLSADIKWVQDGYYLYAKDANGNEMPGEYSAYVDAEDGFNIVTTIDSSVQKELEVQIL